MCWTCLEQRPMTRCMSRSIVTCLGRSVRYHHGKNLGGRFFGIRDARKKPVLSNDHWFKSALKAAGIMDFKWHDLRHTFASWLVQDGVPLDRVSKLLGHKDNDDALRALGAEPITRDVARLV